LAQSFAASLTRNFGCLDAIAAIGKDDKCKKFVYCTFLRVLEAGGVQDSVHRPEYLVDNQCVYLEPANIEYIAGSIADQQCSFRAPGRYIAGVKPAIAKGLLPGGRIAEIAIGHIGVSNTKNSVNSRGCRTAIYIDNLD
jgi:hypothetical protein